MSRRLTAQLLRALLMASALAAGAAPVAAQEEADRGLGARLGLAIGSAKTPGGLRLEGLYLYRLSDVDWFDGRGALTVGSGDAACFRDRDNVFTCDHGGFDGSAGMFSASVRRVIAPRGAFAPFVRVGLGLAVVRFGSDEVTGLALPVIAGGGVAARVSDLVTVGGEANLEVGPSFLGHGVGTALHRSFVVGASVGFQLR